MSSSGGLDWSGMTNFMAVGLDSVVVNKKKEININPRSTMGVKSTRRDCFFPGAMFNSAITIGFIYKMQKRKDSIFYGTLLQYFSLCNRCGILELAFCARYCILEP